MRANFVTYLRRLFSVSACLGTGVFLSGAIAANGAGRLWLNHNVPAIVSQLHPMRALADTNQLQLAISLPWRNQAALSNLLQQLYDPASTNYHHYLTPEQFAERFGPTEADYQKLIAFAKADGFKVTATHANRMLLDVKGSVPVIDNAFHLTLRVYPHPTENRTFYAPDTEPSLAWTVPVLHISGLDNYARPRPRFVSKPLVAGAKAAPNAGSGPGGTYRGNDFRTAYVPHTTLTGSGQAVGLLQFDGYTASDITYYETQAGLPNVPLQNVLVDGATGLPSHTGGEVEVSLDIEMAISMAPGLDKVIVYMAPNPSPFVDLLNRMATDDLARQLSCSWYEPGGTAEPAADQIFQEMAAQGQSFFNASGDNDAYTGLISFPGDTPYVTQVGGTTLTTSGPGGNWASETVWNWGNGIGSGGGVSTQYPIPGWQTNIDMTANQGSTTLRNTPDVALTADNVYVRADNQDYNVGGTSCAAPLWAGFAALANQQAVASGQPAIGFVNPTIDTLAGKPDYTADFHDITTGNNTWGSSPAKFYATSGYDLCTGWGTPAGQKLIDALANPEPLIISPTGGFSSIGGVGGPFTVTYQTFTLTNAGTNTLSWSLVSTSAWLTVAPDSGTLLPGGPADMVTASLNTTASNLLVGVYNATISFTNLNDHFGQDRQFSLAIISPPTITRQPTNQAVLDGEDASFSAATDGGLPQSYQWQFNSNNLTDGGNISGTTTTHLLIRAASATNAGAYRLAVSNAAGVAVSTNALLSVVPSAPVITRQPQDESVVVDGTAQFTVAAVGTKPIAYQWSWNGTNLDGATNAVLTLPDVQLFQAGNYAVALRNIYGETNSLEAVLTVTTCDPAPAGLVSWWVGEGNALDQISGNNGTLNGNVAYGNGQVGQDFVFSGNDGDGVVIGNPPSLQLQNFTIEAWIKRGSTSKVTQNAPNGEFFSYGLNGYCCGIWNGQLYLSKFGVDDVRSISSITDTNWHHVAVTKAGTNVVFYIDGIADSSASYNTTFSFNTPAAIGTVGDSLQTTFLGEIDELSIYNRALSTNEIQDIYLVGSGGKCFSPVPPTITSQPVDQTLFAGQTANFSVTANGTPPLSYQWSFNGTNLDGATNRSLVLPNVQPNNVGDYAVLVSNEADSVLSSNASLTVNPLPPCDPPPSGIVSWWAAEDNTYDQISGNNGTLNGNATYGDGRVGQDFVFTGNDGDGVVVGNPTSLQLQNFTIEAWIKRSSTTSVSQNAPNGEFFSYGTYGYCFGLWNGQLYLSKLGVDSVMSSSSITDTNWHHVAVTKSGSSVVFYIDGSVNSSASYNTTFVFNTPAAIGTRGDYLQTTFLGEIDELSIYSRALSTNEIQAIYLADNGGKCFSPVPPTITSQPADQTLFAGQTANFSVSASGTPPLSYQWNFNNTNIDGATNSLLVLPNVQSNNVGNYAVLLSNEAGSVLSSNATLTVNPLPPCDPPPSGIVSWWAGEGNALDQISDNDGTPTGSVNYVSGEVGQAFNFGADQAGVRLGNRTNLWLQNFTIEAWVKRASSSVSSLNYPDADVFAFGQGGYGFGISADGSLFLTQVGVGNVTVSAGITDTNWHHIAVIKNGSTVVFYADGVVHPASAYNPTFTFNTNPALGMRGDDFFNSFYGTIDELSVYNRALSASEIENIYLAGNGGKCFNPVPPTITAQPSSLTNYVGQTAYFSVVASGTPPLSYQWSFNGTNLDGATNSSLILPNVRSNNIGNYAVLVSNEADSVMSSNAFLSVIPLPPCDPAPAGLVSWWAGEDNALDQISANNGTLVGNATYGNGEVGQSFGFDGNSSGVIVSNVASLQLQVLTIELWIKRGSPSVVSSGGTAALFGYNTGGFSLWMTSQGVTYFGREGYANPAIGPTITDTGFHHLAVTMNGTKVAFYLDGGLYSLIPYSAIFTFTSSPAIACYAPARNNSFLGTLDEVSVYNRVLSQTEIQDVYLAGHGGKCFNPVPPTIITQPTNETVSLGQAAGFTVSAISSTSPLNYQWSFDGTNIDGATNRLLALAHAQFTNAGVYTVLVSNPFASILSSNVTLTVNDVLDHFAWGPISSPQFTGMPFDVLVQAMGTTNEPLTNFTGTVSLSSTNGISVVPPTSANFVQGVWTGSVTISQPATNLVLRAVGSSGQSGLANPVSVVNRPVLNFTTSGNFLLIFWPVASANFVLESSDSLNPAHWVQVTSPPVKIGDQYLESMPLDQTNRFYRLRFVAF